MIRLIFEADTNTLGLWDFAWWIHREMIFHHGLVGTACPHYAQLALIFLFFRVHSRYLS